MDNKKLEVVKTRTGFIAALDQSGGSSAKTLEKYGIKKDEYQTEEEMFDLIHQMRTRVITSDVFNDNHILGTILFYKTMMGKIEGEYSADYLWNKKNIVSFLKVDKGLEEEENGVKLMKPIPDLEKQLDEANVKHVFGTKMRSVIYEANEKGIEDIVNQQFEFAKVICNKGLVPIIEPEVDINSKDKEKLNNWKLEDKIMFKFTIPTKANLYEDLYNYEAVIRVVALSGGYDIDKACELLSKNNKMIASFSRALLENLNVNQTKEEFDRELDNAITKIYNASI